MGEALSTFPGIEVHRRQWVLGPDEVRFGDRWSSRDVAPGLALSWHADLPVRELPNGAVLLGQAVGPEGAHTEWTGRWVLIDAGTLLADPGSMLGPYFRAGAASSSPALLAGSAAERPGARRLRGGQPMDWCAPPTSRLAGVRRLLATQSLELAEWEPVPRAVTVDDLVAVREDATAEVATRLVEAWRALAQLGPLWLPLTAGHDSRLLLASARAAGVAPTTYTFENPRMSHADRELPPRLAALAGVEHRFIRPGPRRPEIGDAFDVHTARHHAGVDRDYLERGQWDAIARDALVVRGGLFEMARRFYHRQLAERLDQPYLAAVFGVAEDEVADWAAWVTAHPWRTVDWRDRFYLDQRVGGWLSALEQGLDLAAPDRIHIANCDRLLAALLSIPEEQRVDDRHHQVLIERFAPELLELPINPPERRREPLATRARITLGRWRRKLLG